MCVYVYAYLSLGLLVLALTGSACASQEALSSTNQLAAIGAQPENQAENQAKNTRSLPEWKTGIRAQISKVVDGDTVVLDFDGDIKTTTARLIGINTPEVRSPFTREQCYGPQASSHLKQLVAQDSIVYVFSDAEPLDKYDRLLVYLFRESDGMFLNHQMVSKGYARKLNIAPNDTFRRDFQTAETSAKSKKLGLWGAC